MAAFYQMFDYPFDLKEKELVLDRFIANQDLGRLWLIKSKYQVIGYLVLAFGFSFEHGGRDAFIDEFYLNEDSRNQGLGKEAMDLVLDEAKKLDIKAVHLEVEADNQIGLGLYKKAGFQGHDRFLLTKVIGK